MVDAPSNSSLALDLVSPSVVSLISLSLIHLHIDRALMMQMVATKYGQVQASRSSAYSVEPSLAALILSQASQGSCKVDL